MDEARAREALTAAGLARAGAGAGASAPRLLALGENAVFALDDGLVAKVGREAALLPRAELELAVAAWLADRGVPAVRAAEPKPRLVDGHPVTLWHRLPDAVRPAGPGDLAVLLRQIHALPAPPSYCPRAICWAGSSAGCGWRAGRSIRRTRRTCGPAATATPPRSPPSPRTSRRARSTATHCPATSTWARTGRCSSTWRRSRPTCASTTWW